MEFAVRHDDGANQRTLYQADLVLTGVSRTSKTPLSMYLAQRGYKTGNVPLIPGIPPPRALLEVDPGKVFGLLVDPATLLTVRQGRVQPAATAQGDVAERPGGGVDDARSAQGDVRLQPQLCDRYGRLGDP